MIDEYVEAQRECAEKYDSASTSDKLRIYTRVVEAFNKFRKLGRDDSLTPEERQYYSDAEAEVSKLFE